MYVKYFINSKGEKHMKKIIITIGVVAIAVVITVIAITNSNNKDKTDSSVGASTFYEEKTDAIAEDNIIPEQNEKQDFNFIAKVDDCVNNITDIKLMDNHLYMSSANIIYKYNYSGCETILESNNNIKKIVFAGKDTFVLQNEDNSYSIYTKDNKMKDVEESKSFKEISGVETDNVIYALKCNSSKNLITISKNNDEIYVNKYELDSDLNVTSKEMNIPLHLSLGMDTNTEVDNIKDIYVSDYNKLYFTLSDGKEYQTGLNILFSDVENGYIKLYTQGTDIQDLDNVNKVYGEGCIFDFSRALFEKIGDNKNIYTYNSDSPLVGNPEDEYKITIALPEKYSCDNIKNILIYEDVIIEFNDSDIYVSEKNNISNLIYNENLSSLNKNQKLKKYEVFNSDIYLLLDDNCLYEFKG